MYVLWSLVNFTNFYNFTWAYVEDEDVEKFARYRNFWIIVLARWLRTSRLDNAEEYRESDRYAAANVVTVLPGFSRFSFIVVSGSRFLSIQIDCWMNLSLLGGCCGLVSGRPNLPTNKFL